MKKELQEYLGVFIYGALLEEVKFLEYHPQSHICVLTIFQHFRKDHAYGFILRNRLSVQ